MIYLDHNATTNLLESAKNAMISTLSKPLNASATHAFGREGKKIIETARRQISSLTGNVNSSRDHQIIFTSSGTEANNLMLFNFRDADIFISSIEHASIANYTKFTNNIQIINVNKDGILDEEDLIDKLSKSKSDKKLVSVIFANNETGVIQNIKKIAQIAHKFDAFIHSDSVQAAGKIPINLADLDVDFVTISSHKIGGPIGSGALIKKSTINLVPHIVGGGQEKGLRSGTENIAAIAGFGMAAEFITEEKSLKHEKLKKLRDYLEDEIMANFPNVKIANYNSPRLPNTSTIINVGKKAEAQIISFDLKGIAISAGSACSSGKISYSNSLLAMGFSKEEISSAIRVSLGRTTTKNDISKFLEIYKEING